MGAVGIVSTYDATPPESQRPPSNRGLDAVFDGYSATAGNCGTNEVETNGLFRKVERLLLVGLSTRAKAKRRCNCVSVYCQAAEGFLERLTYAKTNE